MGFFRHSALDSAPENSAVLARGFQNLSFLKSLGDKSVTEVFHEMEVNWHEMGTVGWMIGGLLSEFSSCFDFRVAMLWHVLS